MSLRAERSEDPQSPEKGMKQFFTISSFSFIIIYHHLIFRFELILCYRALLHTFLLHT